jgi:DNA-directed RNA polymerase specialized sigma24 family protein
MTTVKHAALEIRRRSIRLRELDAEAAVSHPSDDWWELNVSDQGPSLEEQVEDREWVRTRGELLSELKPDERAALSLVAFGLSYREVAERQGWSDTKTNRCLYEGRVRLRQLLALRGEES